MEMSFANVAATAAAIGATFGLVVAVAKLQSQRQISLTRVLPKYLETMLPKRSAKSSAKLAANFKRPVTTFAAGISGSLVKSIATRIADRLVGNRYRQWLRQRLQSAGTLGQESLVAITVNKVIAAGCGVLLGFGLFYRGVADGLIAMLFFGVIGFVFPDLLLLKRARSRSARMERELPDVIDLMRICLLAGLGFENSCARISVAMDGPLAEEFGLLALSVQVGKSRLQALTEWLERSESLALRQFIGALMQVELLGVSMNVALAEIAREARETRKSLLREKSQKMAVHILMPLLFCFMPVMLLIVLGPAMADLVAVLGSL